MIDGEALHKGLEVYYTKGFVEANQAIKHIYETKASYAVDDVEGNTEVLFHLNIISTMFLGYSYLYSMTEFEEYTPEVKGLVTIDNSYSNEPFNLAYRTDARVKKGEVLYLLETKTTSAYSLERYLEELRLDDQADTYLYCERQNNYPAVGVIYNIIRKPKLRQSKYESDEGFMNRIKKVILEDTKREPDQRKYFWRETIYRSPEQLNTFVEETRRIVSDMEKYMVYKSPKRCRDYGGCAFLPMCEGLGPDEAKELYLPKSDIHEELEGGDSEASKEKA